MAGILPPVSRHGKEEGGDGRGASRGQPDPAGADHAADRSAAAGGHGQHPYSADPAGAGGDAGGRRLHRAERRHPVPELLPSAAAGEQSLRRPPDLSNRAAGDEECGAGGVADGTDTLRPAAGGPCWGEADPAVQPDGSCGGHPPQLSGAAVVESAVQCGEVHALRRRGHGDAAGRSGTSAADGGRQRRGHPPGAAGAPLRRLSGEAADAASPTGSGWACPCVRPLPVVTAGGCCYSPARRVPP